MTANEYLVFSSLSSRNGHRIITGFCFVISFFCLTLIYSQDFNQYQRLSHTGSLPEDFLLSPSEKYQLKLDSLQKDSHTIRKAKEAFYQENYYYINELLLSGKVLFNDPVTAYLNLLADHLLKHDRDLRKKIRLYAVKSPYVNAFAANNGIILVNLGLISKLSSEAQLAFILCHEISHISQGHPLDIFLREKTSARSTAQTTRNYSSEEILTSRNHFSQQKEYEADSLGLGLYISAGYDLEASTTVFDILENNQQPFGDMKFDPAYFESSFLQFPDSFFTFKMGRLPKVQDGNGLPTTTHLSPEARKQFVQQKIAGISNQNRKLFQLDKDTFSLIRKICRFESSYYFLREKEYEKAVYSAWFLLKKHPDSHFLQKIIARSLYGLSSYAMAGKLWDVREVLAPQSAYFPFSQLLEQLKSQEIAILALIYNWKFSQLSPEDTEIPLIIDDLMKTIARNSDDISSFHKGKKAVDSTQYDPFISDAMAEMLKDSLFCKHLNKSFEYARRQKELEVFRIQEDQVQKKRNQRKLASSGFNLNLKKVVFVNPSYQRIDDRQESPLQFLESESREKEYIKLLGQHSQTLGLEHKIITAHQLKANDIALFKDLVLLNEWIQEKNKGEGMQMISLFHNEIQQLARKYGTSHFIWTGGLSLTRPRSGKKSAILAGILFPPVLLYSGWYVATPYHDTFIYTMIYDIESGRYLILYPKLIKMKDKFDVLNSVTYDLVLQIKSSR